MVISAFAMTMLISTVMAFTAGGQPRPNAKFPDAFWGPLILMTAGAPVLSLLAFVGCLSARWHKVYVWIDDPLHRARRADAWPPDFSGARQHNMARGPWLIMLAFVVVIAILLGAVVLTMMQSVVLGIVTLICPILWICLLSRGAFANSPGECWGVHAEPFESGGRNAGPGPEY
jgi:hypothetical protein